MLVWYLDIWDWNTHAAAAYEDNAEALQHPGVPHHPGQPQEQNDPEDVLEAGQVDAHERPHLWGLVQRERSLNITTNAHVALHFGHILEK